MNKNYITQKKLSIENVVATFKLDKELNLKKIHLAFKKNSIFNEYTFNYRVVVLRIKKPKMSFLIYRTGKIICTGAKSVKDAKQSSNIIFNLFKKMGLDVKLSSNLTIDNIVAVTNLKSKINLDLISEMNSNIDYQPEIFPGAVCHLKNPKGAILLFASGKIICTGLKEIKLILNAINELKLYKY